MEEKDEKYEEAKALILASKTPCIATIQRHMQIGYNRASRLMEAFVKDGVIEHIATECGSAYVHKN